MSYSMLKHLNFNVRHFTTRYYIYFPFVIWWASTKTFFVFCWWFCLFFFFWRFLSIDTRYLTDQCRNINHAFVSLLSFLCYLYVCKKRKRVHNNEIMESNEKYKCTTIFHLISNFNIKTGVCFGTFEWKIIEINAILERYWNCTINTLVSRISSFLCQKFCFYWLGSCHSFRF